MKRKEVQQKSLVIYQTKEGAIELRPDVAQETLWITQKQMGAIFGVDIRTVNEHIKNILKTKELEEDSVIRKVRITASDGKSYNTNHYNLDMILSVGYRVNSKTATAFRQWATKTLREHITQGYTINRTQIAKNYDAFMQSVADIQKLLPEHVLLDPSAVLELVKEFGSTWVSLDAYDKETLKTVGVTKRSVKLTGEELRRVIDDLRAVLMKKGEATELFAQERARGNVEGIVGNVMQSFGGKAMYPTVEEKAAHLLYFMVKNHPFSDGNKRSGAFAFVWFLRKAKAKKQRNINPTALTALTLLIAESDPKKKEQMVALVTQMLR